MTCGCNLKHNAQERYDPTKTTTLRRQWENDFKRRYKGLMRDITKTIVDNDVFSLKSNEAATKDRFEFARDPRKIALFMDWLEQEQSRQILGVSRGTTVLSAAENSWQNVYIDSAYKKALRQSATRMRRQGARVSDRFVEAAFNRPVHADTAGIIYTRAFQNLDGITREMDKQISRILSRGIIDGIGARALAKQINDRVQKIGITRSRMLARTEVIAAHAEATLNMYEEAGLEGVTVQAEFTTAGDDSVCPECEALEGKIYTIEESRGVIPVHPNCRCTFLPVLDPKKAKTINLE